MMINLRLVIMFMTVSVLTACAVGPNYQLPFTAMLDNFSNSTTSEFSNKTIALKWWELFKDQQINALVNQMMLNNQDLKVAHANLREARALYMEAGLNLAPTVTTHSNYTDQLRSTGSMNNRSFVPRDLSLYSAGFDAVWELDLFGRVRRNIEASNDEVEMQDASLNDIKVSLIAEVVRNYVELRGLQNQLAIVKKNVENQQQMLDIIQVRVENGRGTELDIARVSAQLDNTHAIVPSLEIAMIQAIHRLSVLTGQVPDALTVNLSKVMPIPTLPAVIAVGHPADLLRRRPDIQMVERRLAASTARIGIAMADLFPKVTFVGSIAIEATTFSSMGASGSDAYSLGPRISWAAFDLGRVYARIKASDAHAEADLARYQQAVLVALEETENTLVSYNKTKIKQEFLASAVQSSLKAYELAQLRFNGGMTDFMMVLESQLRLLQDQNQLAQNQINLATNLVAVYKSLGG